MTYPDETSTRVDLEEIKALGTQHQDTTAYVKTQKRNPLAPTTPGGKRKKV